ncbi:MAG: dTMP kinase [Holosporales bacterium]|jgi:dTMP kinase|nr:dTMP kinase [Holosporales bacterium]
MLVTFEGGEGCGKSVQARLLHDHLVGRGKKVLLVREPGSTALAESIRRVLLVGDTGEDISPVTEALLFMTARSDLWLKKIKPALDAGSIVICDRFQDSTVVYQGECGGVDQKVIDTVYRSFAGRSVPDRTYFIDIDPAAGIDRSLSKLGNNETRFERMDLEFHKRVRGGFLKLARANPERFFVIDGTVAVSEIHNIITEDMKSFMPD